MRANVELRSKLKGVDLMSGLESLQRLLLSALILLLAAWAITWIAATALKWAGAGDRSGVIVPFQVSGKGEDGAAMGKTLAMLLQSRLPAVRQQMEVVNRLLGEPPTGNGAAVVRPPELPGPQQVVRGERLFEPLDIAVSLGGLEVGGLIKRLQELSMRDRALRIAIHFEDGEGKTADISADLAALGLPPVWLRTSSSTSADLIDQLAFAIARQQQAVAHHPLGLLGTDQFRQVVQLLDEVAHTNEQVRRSVATAESFRELLRRFEALDDSLQRWPAFVRIEAQVAENAGEASKAAALYRGFLLLPEVGEDESQWATQRLAVVTRPEPGSSPLLLPSGSSEALAQRVQALRRQLGVTGVGGGAGVTVAIFGALPPEGLLGADQAARVQRLGPPGGKEPSGLAAYTAAMIQQVALVAPEAEFLVVEVEDLSAARLLAALDQLLARQAGGIALLPLAPLPSSALPLLRKMGALGWTFVVSVGNERDRSNVGLLEAARSDELLVVGAVGETGEPAEFSVRGDGVLYAPGERIPIPRPIEGMGGEMSGTGPASALAAGVAASLLAAHRDLASTRLVATLRGTATSRSASAAPELDFAAALAALTAVGAPPAD